MIKARRAFLMCWVVMAGATVFVGPSSVAPKWKVHDHGLPGHSHLGAMHNGGKPGPPIFVEWGNHSGTGRGSSAEATGAVGSSDSDRVDAIASSVRIRADLEVNAIGIRVRKLDAQGNAIAEDSQNFDQLPSGEAFELDVRSLMPNGAVGESLALDIELRDLDGGVHSRSHELRPPGYSHPALHLEARSDFSDGLGLTAQNPVKSDENALKTLAKRAAASVVELANPTLLGPDRGSDLAPSRISKDSDGVLVESFQAQQDPQ